ncbi:MULTISPECIES: sulfur carrier protein ThiS [Paenibacillus]|uniref:sulfur carrier protein ThiS n=1 Tax=Paenibacillus TaxID=44249 RepID=UPI00203AEFD8|nr:sulfur carrier protein ThiS [Paenibacillus camelliae]MCM3635839.1 sulfur carrier protein ThiS [Paenibacillus camelliae]
MELIINGKVQQLEAKTIKDVVEHFGLSSKPIVVEADGVVLVSEQWVDTAVKPGMKIELVHFVGGG